MHVRPLVHRLRGFARVVLVGTLPLAPALALAALAPYDLAGVARAVPTTIGALEASTGLAPPRGLTLTIERSAH